jgi:hypothetical protein
LSSTLTKVALSGSEVGSTPLCGDRTAGRGKILQFLHCLTKAEITLSLVIWLSLGLGIGLAHPGIIPLGPGITL